MPRVRRPLARFAALAAAMAATPPAFAQTGAPAPGASTAAAGAADPQPLGEALTGTAAQDYGAARLLYGSGDYAGALVKFQRAYDASKDPRLLWNAAACEKGLRHYAKAAALVRLYADAGPPLVPVAATAVYLDGELLGTTPLADVRVDIGSRRVTVEKDGFRGYATTLIIAGNDAVRVDATLVAVVHRGRLAVLAAAGDVITIDGASAGVGRWEGELPSGGHQLRVTAPEKYAYQSDVVIADDQQRTIDVTLEAKPHGGVPAWVWIVGGTVLAAGAVTTAFLVLKPSDQQAAATAGTISPGTVQLP